MLSVRTNRQNAERVKKYLKKAQLIDKNYKVFSKNSFIYFPLAHDLTKRELAGIAKFNAALAETRFARQHSKVNYREELLQHVGESEFEKIAKSYDILGNIAIIEADAKNAKKIASAIFKTNKNVKTVLRKGSAIKGIYRTRSFHFVAGKKNYITNYKENNSTFRFDVRKTFFSPRLSYERKRIAEASRNGENVIVMFAGVGPFAIEIAKQNKKSKIVAMELNKDAYKYMLENVRLNKLSNVITEQGDVKKLASKYARFANRIIMPLPKDSYNFLNSVLVCAKKNCIVHYYAFGASDSAFTYHISKIREFFSQHKKEVEILSKRVVRPYSASEIEVVIDFMIK